MVQRIQFSKNFLKFAQQLSRPGKSLENRDIVWKNSAKSGVSFNFCFQSYNKCLTSEFFPRGQISFNNRMRSFIILLCPHCIVVTVRLQYIMKKAWFLRFSRSLLITYLFITLSLETKYCFGKSLEVWIQKSVRTLLNAILCLQQMSNLIRLQCTIKVRY